MATNEQKLGAEGENKAIEHLKQKGFKILGHNWKNKWGEIDIIAQDKEGLVFVEVKTIEKLEGFWPEDEIDFRKENQLRKMAQIYLNKNRYPIETPYQIDIIAIEKQGRDWKIEHFENALEDIDK